MVYWFLGSMHWLLTLFSLLVSLSSGNVRMGESLNSVRSQRITDVFCARQNPSHLDEDSKTPSSSPRR